LEIGISDMMEPLQWKAPCRPLKGLGRRDTIDSLEIPALNAPGG